MNMLVPAAEIETPALRKTKGTNDTDACEAFGRRLSKAMEDAGMTQSDVARAMGKTRSAVSWWATGKTYPSWDHSFELAGLLGTTPWWLMYGVHAVQSKEANVHVPIHGRNTDSFITLPLDFVNLSESTASSHLQGMKITGTNGQTIAVVNTDDRQIEDTVKTMAFKSQGAIRVVKAFNSPNKQNCIIIEDDHSSTETMYKPDMFIGRVSAMIESQPL